MPTRLNNKPLAAALEAIIRYADDGSGIRYEAIARADGTMRLTFDFDNMERYQSILREVQREQAESA